MPDQAPEADARAFAASFRSFLDWVHTADDGDRRNEVAVLVAGFLGPDGAAHSVVSRDLPAFEHVNLQTAINAWSALPGRTVEISGVLLPPHFSLQLQQIVSAESAPGRLRLTAPTLIDLPNGPDSTLGCLRLALLLVSDARGRYILMVQSPAEHHPGLEVEVAGLPVTEAQAVLFDLLDAMDGAAPDADLLFLLTTNRADLLEPALAARPGRVDVAVEIELPDAAARERLLALYGRGVPMALAPEDIATAVERTDGTTASFLKELIRRSVLESLHDAQGPAGAATLSAVTGAHLTRALDDLLDSAQGVTRTLLGVGVDPATLPAGGALAMSPARMMAQRRAGVIRASRG